MVFFDDLEMKDEARGFLEEEEPAKSTGDFALGDLGAFSPNTTLAMGTIPLAEERNKYEIQRKCR